MKAIGKTLLIVLALALFALPVFAVTVEKKMTTRFVDPNTCDTPIENHAFITTDNEVWLWFLVSGTNTGDQARVEWRAPDGSIYRSASWNPLTSGGGKCFRDNLAIADTSAVNKLGVWNVKVFYNNNTLFSFTFNLLSVSMATTRFVDVNNQCTIPAETTIFSTAENRVWAWFPITGVSIGDRVRIEWYAPDDSLYSSYTWDPLSFSGKACYSAWIAIAGSPPANTPGNWRVKTFFNDEFLSARGFTIVTSRYNSLLAFQVAADGHFNAGAAPDPATGFAGTNSYGIMYRWPGYPFSSFTTVRIDGNDLVYGRAGFNIESPANIDAKTNRSRWQIGDIEVTQILQLAFNSQTGREDVIKISYVLRNTGTTSHSVGQRVLIDTDINRNDGVPFRVPGVGIVKKETEFTGASVPDSFQAFFDVTDTQRITVSTLKSGGATAPDRLVLAGWPNLNGTNYDYAIDPNFDFTKDSAYAVYWNPKSLAPGESRTYTTFYGLSALQVDTSPPLALGLSGPATLTVVNNAYSPDPFDVVATIYNNGGGAASNVQLTLNLPNGLGLAGGTAVVPLGQMAVGQERQVSWRVSTGARTGAGAYTYSVTLTASNAQAKTVSRTLTLPQLVITNSLSGTVGIWDGNRLWKLNGSGIELAVTASPLNSNASPQTIKVTDGTYQFEQLSAGAYNLSAVLKYRDEVTVNNLIKADLVVTSISRGCEGKSLQKTAELKVGPVEVQGNKTQNLEFRPPVVMVHGYAACYQKWFKEPSVGSSDPKLTYWGNYVQGNGVISFTPNYKWYGLTAKSSWSESVSQITMQIENGFKGLSKEIDGHAYPNWFYVSHSTGGLVGRVLAYQNEGSALVKSLKKLYLLGAPNSGAYGKAAVEYIPVVPTLFSIFQEFTEDGYPMWYYLSENAVQTDFNKRYRSFRDKDVMVFAGNADSVQVSEADGVVRVDYVYNIETKGNFLSLPDLKSPKLNGKTFRYIHEQLGSADSLDTILVKEILPDTSRLIPPRVGQNFALDLAAMPSVAEAETTLEPAEAAQAISFVSARLQKVFADGQKLDAAQTAMHTFTVGPTDVFTLSPLVFTGTTTFVLLDPAGNLLSLSGQLSPRVERTNDPLGETFILRNPAPGQWQLRTTAGSAGALFVFVVKENSPVRLDAAAQEPQVQAGQAVTLAARFSGNASSANVIAQVINETGATVGAFTLFDDGQHQDGAANDGLFAAQSQPILSRGRYSLAVTARAFASGLPLIRQAEAFVDVLPAAHLLASSFSDAPVDIDGDGRSDAVRVTVGFTAPTSGSYLVYCELLDTQGLFVARTVGSTTASAPGSVTAKLDFSLTGVSCQQFANGFALRNLTLAGGNELKTLDVLTGPGSTQKYDGVLFTCANSAPALSVLNLQPGALFPVSASQIVISGNGFANGARVSLGAGITVASVTYLNSELLLAQVSLAANAAPGPREVTVVNPGGRTATAANLFSVASDQPPAVLISAPMAQQFVRGTVTVSAAASDDRGIQKIEFYLDGQFAAADMDFPYQFVWQTATVTNGNHVLAARAYDTAGQTREAQLTVTVGNTTVATVSAASFTGATLAAESIVAAFGTSLATSVQIASSLPLPTSLAGTTVKVKDSAGTERLAPLFFVAPSQINYQIPPGTANGAAAVTVTSGDGEVSTGAMQIVPVAPGLFSVNASGQGLAAAVALRVRADGSQSYEPIARFDSAQNKFVAVPIDLGPPADQVFLILYGTGCRLRSSLPAVTVKIGGADAESLYAGLADGFVGLDQLNVRLPRSLAGRGEVDLVLTVDGKPANIVRVSFR